MTLTFTDHVGDGATATFPFTFEGPDNGYFREDDIFVYVDDVSVPFTITGPTQVTLVEPPADGSAVRVRRVMPINAPYTDFIRGNNFGQTNVNRSFQQQLYTTHELLDGFKPVGYFEKQDIDMGGHTIKNLKDGVDPQDPATIAQLANLDPELGGNILTDEMVEDIEASKAHITSDGSSHSKITNHISNTNNPHEVNASDVNCLAKDNITAYVPLLPYHPATRKFVLDAVSAGTGVSDHGELTGLDDDDHSAVYLSKFNTIPFTPTSDYHPATRKFVLDNSGGGGIWTDYGGYIEADIAPGVRIYSPTHNATGQGDGSAIYTSKLITDADNDREGVYYGRLKKVGVAGPTSHAGSAGWIEYINEAIHDSGFSIGMTTLSICEGLRTGGTAHGNWTVVSGSNNPANGGLIVGHEINTFERRSGIGFKTRETETDVSIGLFLVPEASLNVGYGTEQGHHGSFACSIRASTAGTFPAAKWYTGYSVALDSVVPYTDSILTAGMRIQGGSTPALAYGSGIRLSDYFRTGINTETAVFGSDNAAITMASDQKIRIGNASVYGSGSDQIQLYGSGGVVLGGGGLDVNASGIVDINTSSTATIHSNGFTVDNTGDLYAEGLNGLGYLKSWYVSTYATTEMYGKDYISLATNSDASLTLTGAEGFPRLAPTSVNKGMDLGAPTIRFRNVYANAYYDDGGGYNDTLDDLKLLHDMKSLGSNKEDLDEYGLEVQDVHSLPEYMTNKREIVDQLVADNLGLLTQGEAEEYVDDPEEMGHMKQRHIGKFADLTAGAVRQLDIKTDKRIIELTERVDQLEAKLERAMNIIEQFRAI